MSVRAVAIGAAAGALLLAGLLAERHWYGARQYRAGQQQRQEAYRVAGLEEFKEEAERLAGISQGLAKAAQRLADEKPKTIERYTREIAQNPLPTDCVRDPGRVRATNEAIDAANAARQHQRTVPAGAPH